MAVQAWNSSNGTAPNASSYPYTLEAYLEEKSVDINSNSSNVYVSTKLSSSNASFSTNSSHTLTIYYKYGNDGNVFHQANQQVISSMGKNSSVNVEATVSIPHNADGTQSMVAYAVWDKVSSNGYVPDDFDCGTSWVSLTTIPRASSVYCPDFYIGSGVTVQVSRASDSFYHTLTFSFGNASGTIANNVGTSAFWNPQDTLYSQIPNATSGVGSITCITYSNGNEIGRNSTQFTARVENLKPSVSGSAEDVNATTLALTGSNKKVVKGFSNVKITGTATAQKYASISSYLAYCNDNKNSTSNPATLNNVNSNLFGVYAKDSRGFENSYTISDLTLVDYSSLGIKSYSIERPESTSNTINANITLNYWGQNFGSVDNTLEAKWRYKESSSTTWSDYTNITMTTTTTEATYSATLGTSFDWNTSYDFQFIFTDKLVVLPFSYTVPKGIESLSIGDNFIASPKFYKISEVDGSYSDLVINKGEKGDTGATGATGPANTLSIGTVTSGTTASATITGTSPSQTLNLVLPKGEKGDTGNVNISSGTVLPTTANDGDYFVLYS